MCGVTPGRVSQWIAEGKIHGSALVSRGRVEMVDADLAREQLRDSLDVDKRFGLSGLSTNLRGPSDQATLSDSTVEEQIRAEKLRHAQLMTSRLEEEDRARRGVYVATEKVRGEIALAATDLLRAFEGALPTSRRPWRRSSMFRSETRFTYCAESFVDFASASRLRMRRLQPLCRGPSLSTIRNLTVFSEQGRPPKAAPVVC